MRRIFALSLVAVVSACDSAGKVSGPIGPVEEVSMAFCDFFRPTWMAIRNNGTDWQQVTVPATGPITFDATEKVSIAMVIAFFGDAVTLIANATRDELDGGAPSFLGCDALSTGNRELSGSVSGLATGDIAGIHAGFTSTHAFSNGELWTADFLSDVLVDLIATRLPAPSNQTPDLIIVRRGVQTETPPSVPIPALNFGAAEALPPELFLATITGIGTGIGRLISSVSTANGTFAELTGQSGIADGAHAYMSVPAAHRLATDMHMLQLEAEGSMVLRQLSHWYQTPAAKTLALGPDVGVPTITEVETSPHVRMRAVLASQPEYPDAAAASFVQSENDIRFIQIITTAAFLDGTPTSWEMTIPDMSAGGYQAAWGLVEGELIDWEVSAFQTGGAYLFGSTAPPAGTTVRVSTRLSPPLAATSRVGETKRYSLKPFGTAMRQRRR